MQQAPIAVKKTNRVLYLSAASQIGGATCSLFDLIRNLDRQLYQPVMLLTQNECEEFRHEISMLDVEQIQTSIKLNSWLANSSAPPFQFKNIISHLKAPGRFARHLFNAICIAKVIKKHHIDIVHTNDENLIDGALGAKLSMKPHVWHIRSRIGKDGLLNHFLGKVFVLKVIHFLSAMDIVNSSATYEPWKSSGITESVRLIHNGININLFKNRTGKLKREYHLQDETPIVAMVSTNPEFDGLHHFIDAAACLFKVQPETHFFMIGKMTNCNGEYLNKQRDKLAESKLEKNFIFTGFRRDLPELFPDIDVIIEPMRNGSWSRVVLEAMAAGVTIIAVEEGGVSDFLTHGETGFLVPSQKDLGTTLVNVFSNREALLKIRKRAQQYVEKQFSSRKYAENVMKVYNDLIKCK